MKRKFFISVLVLITAICTLFGFAACDLFDSKDSEKEHTHEFEKAVVYPTCTEKGYTVYTCSCGEEYVDDYVDERGHEFTLYNSNNDATCTVDGTKTAFCNHEGCTAFDTIADVGSAHHTPLSAVKENQVAPTKIEDGGYDEVVYCDVCKEEISRTHVTVSKTVSGTEVCSKTLTVSLQDKTLYTKLSNGTALFDFSGDIVVAADTTYFVCTSQVITSSVPDKKVSLETGDNVFYLFVMHGEEVVMYTVTLRVKPMYTVTFATGGGSLVESQTVEEDDFATTPVSPTRAGYLFLSWDYDFATPITEDTTITANWQANEDTPYKVVIRRQKIETPDYADPETYDYTGTTDSLVSVDIADYVDSAYVEGFYIDDEKSNAKGNISGDGSSVFTVFLTRKVYKIINKTPEYGVISCKQYSDLTFRYNAEVVVQIQYFMGCHFDPDRSRYSVKDLKSAEYVFYGKSDINIYLTKDDEIKDYETVHDVNKVVVKGYTGKGGAVVIPECVHEIAGAAFSRNTNITSLEFKFQYMVFQDFALAYMKALTSIKLPPHMYSLSNGLLFECTALKTLVMPNSVQEIISNAFNNCTSLEHITFSTNLRTLGTGAFSGCDSLKEIILPDSCVNIGQEFVNLKSVEKIVMPKKLNDFSQVFVSNCPELKSVFFPKNMTEFRGYIIEECPKLECIVLGDKITSRGYQNIRGAEQNINIYFDGTPAQLSAITGYDFGPCGNTVYCYSATSQSGYFHYNENGDPVLW